MKQRNHSLSTPDTSVAMESRKPPEYTLELSADRSSVKDVVKGMSDAAVRVEKC